MKIIVFTLVGFFYGLLVGSFPSAIISAAIGWLIGNVFEQNEKIKKHEEKIKLLSQTLTTYHQPSQQATNVATDTLVEPTASEVTSKNNDSRIPLSERITAHEELSQKNIGQTNSVANDVKPLFETADTSMSSLPHYSKNHIQQEQNNLDVSRARIETQKSRENLTPANKPKAKQAVNFGIPSFINDLIAKTSLITRVGVIILFFGIGFLLKYASENVSVPIELRLIGVAIGGLVLFFIGWRFKEKKSSYSVILQGTAIGIWYLVIFASMKLYSVIPASTGFFILFLLSLLSAVLSVKQNAKALAVFGILGGFLAPILASTGSGSHIMLFGYYAVLNVGIVSIVWFKAWRALTLMGFVFTFVIGVVWGVTQYQPELFRSTEPFLLLYIVFYVAVVMIFALRKQWAHDNILDGPLVYGTPVIGFGLQSVLVGNYEYGLAWSALGFGLFYLSVAVLWWRLLSERSTLLRESFLAIGLVFVSLSIPFAFDYDVSALLWALEGGGAVWLSVRQKRVWGCLLAILVQLGSGFFWIIDLPDAGEQLFLNPAYLTAAGISLVGLFTALLLRNQKEQTWSSRFPIHSLSVGMLTWSLLWWFVSGFWQIIEHVDHQYYVTALLLFFTSSCFALFILRKKFDWEALNTVLFLLLPASCLVAVASDLFIEHPFESFGWFAWPLTIGCLYWLYNKAGLFLDKRKRLEKLWHGVTFLLAVALLSREVWWQINEVTSNYVWKNIGLGLISLGAVWCVLKFRCWQEDLNSFYRETLVGILFAGLILNFLSCCFLVPDVSPLLYFPVLNPLDVWQLAIILSISYWWRNNWRETKTLPAIKAGWAIIATLVFSFVNVLLLRTLHRFADIPFNPHALFNSDLVQTCLSIFWAILGIGLFYLAKRTVRKEFWMLGMVLFGAVVLKLFIIDLANSGTVERIISFIVVGLLLLGVGYLKPETSLDEKNR